MGFALMVNVIELPEIRRRPFGESGRKTPALAGALT
jgi:hypothetical protein